MDNKPRLQDRSPAKSVTFSPKVSVVEFSADSTDEEKEGTEVGNNGETAHASLCFGGWCEDSSESGTVRSVTVVDMTDGSFWESPVSHLDPRPTMLNEYFTETVHNNRNRPLSPIPKNSSENDTSFGPLSRGSLSLVESVASSKDQSCSSIKDHPFDSSQPKSTDMLVFHGDEFEQHNDDESGYVRLSNLVACCVMETQ
jgi:hypothetical protein